MTATAWVPVVTTGAGIHRGDESESSGPGEGERRARDEHLPILQRDPERLERRATKFRELIKEEDPMVGEGDLAGAAAWSTTGERYRREAVMGRSKWTRLDEGTGGGEGA